MVNELKRQAVWIAKALFDRGKVTGSTGNLSFRHGNDIWLTRSGSCFGNLHEADFVCSSNEQSRLKASKEWPLHHALYSRHTQVQAVIHTHSAYSTVWSCLPHENPEDVIPGYTPYLQMKLGKVALVPYAPPGSEALFSLFQQHLGEAWGYLLANHGPVVAGKTLMDGFYALEELEESARIAWLLKGENIRKL